MGERGNKRQQFASVFYLSNKAGSCWSMKLLSFYLLSVLGVKMLVKKH
jgi:hypothetical protein